MFKNLFADLPRRNTFIFLFFLIVITSITYSNHFENAFHFDDSHTIQNNIYIQDLKNIPLFFKDGTTFSSLPSNQSYRPVVSASLAIDYWLGGGYDLFYFHLSNFLLFLFQGVLMFFLIFKLFQLSYKNDWNFYIAAGASLWYSLHPANAETVNYIIARSDIQSTLAVVAAFVIYLFSPFSKKYFLYLILIGIGALAKPPAVMFAPILFFYVLLFEENVSLSQAFNFNKYGKQIMSTGMKVLPTFVFCIVLYFWVDYKTPETWQSGGLSKFNYLITQPFVVFHYFITFFLPFGLSADTDWQTLESIWDIRFFVGIVFIFLMALIAFWFSNDKRLRPISFGIIWFFLALIPSSSIIPFAEVLNDHRIFFPYVGLVISVCWTIGLLLLKSKTKSECNPRAYSAILLSIVLVFITSYAFGTYQRNKVWKTEETLWYDVTIKSPQNGRGLMNYGLAKMGKGDYITAEKYFLKALEIWPTYSSLHINMGVLKQATGDFQSAEMYFKNGINYGAIYPDCWFFYGKFLSNQNRLQEATVALEKSIELSAAHIGARSELMKVYLNTNNLPKLRLLAQQTLEIIPNNAEAMQYLEKAKNDIVVTSIPEKEIEKAPTPEKYLDLSLQYYQAEKYNECINACEQAIKLKPDYADAYSNMCAAYNQLKQWDSAIGACRKALQINAEHQLAKGNLNWALQEKFKVN